MKNSILFSALVAIVGASVSIASAETIQLGSYATGASALGNANTAMNYAGYQAVSTTPSVGTGASAFLDPSTVWAPALANSTWVGNSATAGPVGTSNPDFGYYTYTTNFSVATGQQYQGSITILADDTAEVLLNGVVLIPFGALGTDLHCSDVAPTCLTSATYSIGLTSMLAGINANTLTFIVEQKGTGPAGGVNDPAGIDFNASLTAVPEPNTLMMLGTGLFGSAGMLYRRMRS